MKDAMPGTFFQSLTKPNRKEFSHGPVCQGNEVVDITILEEPERTERKMLK